MLWLIGVIWFIISSVRGQSPGKQLLSMYVIDRDGMRAGGGLTFLRELLIKWVVVGFISFITSGIFGLAAALWCLWDRNRQCLWDKFVNTYVAYSPQGFVPQTAQEQLASGGVDRRLPGGVRGGPLAPEGLVINISNSNSAQSGGISAGMGNVNAPPPSRAAGAAMVSVAEGGRPGVRVPITAGQQLLVGREPSAQVHISDPYASRRHLLLTFDGAGWTVLPLGTNPTRLLYPDGRSLEIRGEQRMPHGQLRIGSALVTLHPPSPAGPIGPMPQLALPPGGAPTRYGRY